MQLVHHCEHKAKMMKDRQLFRVINDNCWDPVVRLADMDRTGAASEGTGSGPVARQHCRPVIGTGV